MTVPSIYAVTIEPERVSIDYDNGQNISFRVLPEFAEWINNYYDAIFKLATFDLAQAKAERDAADTAEHCLAAPDMPEEPQTIQSMRIGRSTLNPEPEKEVVAYINALRAYAESLRADAERYRWMRDHATYAGADQHRLDWYLPRTRGPLNEQLDAAIDAAREKPHD